MVLRLDDTDVERNTDASVQSIFEGLRWLGLDWTKNTSSPSVWTCTAKQPKQFS